MAANGLGDRRLVARAGLALVLANARYWTSVAPIVRRELKRWQLRAHAIDNPELRALALSKLDGEGFHAEAAAMLATLTPCAHRSSVVEAIVALELLFDYLDGLTELPSRDPLREGDRLFEVLRNAVTFPRAGTSGLVEQQLCNDGGYLDELSRAVSAALGRLPGAATITQAAQRVASRSGEAQTRMHAAAQIGTAQLEEWARVEAEGVGLGWRELVAGSASSVLVLHALIDAAADPRMTPEAAARIAEAYLSMCVLVTLLDGVVDYEDDASGDGSSAPGFVRLYDLDELADTMGAAARRAIGQARALPEGAHHVMLLAGVVAYYSSAPGAESEFARSAIDRLRRELAPLISPTLAVMRTWRIARRRTGATGAVVVMETRPPGAQERGES